MIDAWREFVGAVAQDSEAARTRIGNRPPDRVGVSPDNINIANAARAGGFPTTGFLTCPLLLACQSHTG